MLLTEDPTTRAIAELAKEGMALTVDIGANGKKIYLIDSVALAEDEIVVLCKKRALTRVGIRHYLVARAA